MADSLTCNAKPEPGRPTRPGFGFRIPRTATIEPGPGSAGGGERGLIAECNRLALVAGRQMLAGESLALGGLDRR